MEQSIVILPRLIRLKHAPAYVGMDRNRFNREVRPHVRIVSIGTQGRAVDRLELDAWVDEYVARCNGRSGKSEGDLLWGAKGRQASSSAAGFGTSTNKFEVADFAKALEKATSKKRRST